MTPIQAKIKMDQLLEKKKFLLIQRENIHQIKEENCHASVVTGESKFIKLEIPKMQLMQNLDLQIIEIKKEIRELEPYLPKDL